MTERLPLFPLSTVLFPGAELPLRIFEPRYVLLLHDLLRLPPEQRCFGVVALRLGHEVGPDAALDLHEIGCATTLLEISPLGMAQYAVRTRAARRFALSAVLRPDSTDKPYLLADVTWLDEPDGADPTTLASQRDRLAGELAAYRRVVQERPVTLPTDPADASYRLGDAIHLDTTDRQALLAAPSTADRLALGRQLLARETGIVQRIRALPRPVDPGAAGLN